MKYLSLFPVLFLWVSCIPLRVAPTIKTDKIMQAQKFKKNMPNNYVFIVEDPKDADEFYNFINTKFKLNNESVDMDVPIKIDGKPYYLSFIETEKTTKTLNILPLAVDAALESKDNDPVLEDMHVSRNGTWYLMLLVFDDSNNDCLNPKHSDREKVVNYLRHLHKEYLNTANYLEAQLKNISAY